MKVIRSIRRLRGHIHRIVSADKTVGFVPTMGALHEGHVSLIKRAGKETDIVVVSIFVNPAQFGPNEDYLKYPRPFARDKKVCEKNGVDVIFAPSVREMYPRERGSRQEHTTFVDAGKMAETLCGKFRPGHFRGVATVVAKLFNIVRPDRAYFGTKDFQQIKIIEKIVLDLDIPVRLARCGTVREKDGLAMSSRNAYLHKKEREYAPMIYRAMNKTKRMILAGRISTVERGISEIKREIGRIPGVKIQYAEFCDTETLERLKGKIRIPLQALVAVFIGKTRLIDNIRVG